MDYQTLWDTTIVGLTIVPQIKEIRIIINSNKSRYQQVADTLKNNMPWWMVAVIHYREADLDFTGNLANGDPLTHRTVNEPVGRPLTGNPPFTW